MSCLQTKLIQTTSNSGVPNAECTFPHFTPQLWGLLRSPLSTTSHLMGLILIPWRRILLNTLYTLLIFLIRVTCLVHLILFNLIIIIIGKGALFSHSLPYKILPDLIFWISQQYFFYGASSSSLSPTPILEGRSLYLRLPVTRWSSYTPRERVPFSSPSTTRRTTEKVS
jgi:hypothetical protein